MVKTVGEIHNQTPVNPSELYKDIELTELERETALMLARKQKSAEINFQKYKERLFGEKEYPVYTAEEVKEQLRKYLISLVKQEPGIEPVVFDKWNEHIVDELCYYFTNDSRCTLDLSKGLLLQGPIGCGKTALMKFFRYNQTNSFQQVHSKFLAENFAGDGYESLRRYHGLIKTTEKEKCFGQEYVGLCFEDIGDELDQKYYGNENNVIGSILTNRHLRCKEDLLAKTHVTTNLIAKDLNHRYGARLASRMREMFNLVLFDPKAPDRRK